MNDRFEDIFKKIRDIRLSPEEKLAMRQSLLEEMMGRRPAAAAVRRSSVFTKMRAAWPSWPRLVGRPALVSVLAGGMLLTGSGVSYAAESSLPGDALYPVKIGVNEPVREVLAVTPRAKAVWAARRVERRLEEAEALAAGAGLKRVSAGAIQQAIVRQAQRAGERLEWLTETGEQTAAVDVGFRLEMVLEDHQERLSKMAKRETRDDHEELEALSSALEMEVENIARRNGKSEDRLVESRPEDAAPAAAGRLDVAERKVREVLELMEDHELPGPREAVRQDLVEADRLLTEGRQALDDGQISKAFIRLRRARQAAHEAKETLEDLNERRRERLGPDGDKSEAGEMLFKRPGTDTQRFQTRPRDDGR